ncbi:MAG: M23 family metallopeptidase [Clostridia bacterium]|nr:M23 family metallopeptidase [Clostridia bacterium]
MQQARALLGRLRDRILRFGIRRLVLVTVAALFLLLPSFFAFLYIYVSDHTITVFQSEKIRAELYTADGTMIAGEEAASDYIPSGSLVELLQTMDSTKIKTNKTAKDLASLTSVSSVLREKSRTVSYTCYFSLAANDSYCMDESGTVYRLEQSVCDRFFSRHYAEPFYGNAVLPALVTSDGEAVTPKSVSWHYKNWDHQYTEAHLNPTTDELSRSYDMPGALSLSFSAEPDICQIEVFDEEGHSIYTGTHLNLEEVVGEPARMAVTAYWNEHEDGTYYGSASYEFSVKIRDRAVFSLERTATRKGSAVLLSCTNIFDPSRLTFSNLTDGGEVVPDPVFYTTGTTAQALLVFPSHISLSSFEFSVSYGATEQAFSVRLLPTAALPDYTIEDDRPLWRDALRELERYPISAFAAPLLSPQSNLFYSPNDVCLPLGKTDYVGYGFGATVFCQGSSLSFQSPGVEYLATDSEEQAVAAVKSGLVIHKGYSDFLGHFIVLEHGLGLRTWYCHLSSTEAETGAYVRCGETVGRTGMGATASANGVLLLCTVGDQLLNPAFLFDKK